MPNFKVEDNERKVKAAGVQGRKLVVQYFLQECLHPRVKLSPIDASFCARFLRVLHNAGAANFPSLHIYDRVSDIPPGMIADGGELRLHIGSAQLLGDELPPIVFSCTEGEARNYARFMHDILADLSVWYNSEVTYNKQAIGNNLPGFQRAWGTRIKPNEVVPEDDYLTYAGFKQITQKWHGKMTTVTSRHAARRFDTTQLRCLISLVPPTGPGLVHRERRLDVHSKCHPHPHQDCQVLSTFRE